ncbi:MAG: branched-chain amino acid ABC transporter permease [Gammaproteobacteria bacterium]|nr:branched-chain amino acid ABC transporter permease [Gammaproteobacteria bacterium]
MQSLSIDKRKGLVAVLLLGFLLLAPTLAELTGHGYLIGLFTQVVIYAIAAVSLDLIMGYGGMVSFGHAAFFGLGAYVAGIFGSHHYDGTALLNWPVEIFATNNGWLILLASLLICGLLATVIGMLSLRTSGVYFIMITLAFSQMLYFLFISLGTYGGEDGLALIERNHFTGLDSSDEVQFYYLCLGILLIFLLFVTRLVGSRFGLLIRACKTNEPRMRSLGFSTYRYRVLCFAIAGAGAGVAGALFSNHIEYVSPQTLHWTQSGQIMIMVILGGLGSLLGPVLGALFLLSLEETLSMHTEHWQLWLAPFLLLVVLYSRQGLFGLLAGGKPDV